MRPILIALTTFLIGACIIHVLDLWRSGWLPYRFAPLPPNVYWTSLVRSMKFWFPVLVLFAANFASAQTNSDEEALRVLPKAFSVAWAEHNGHKLAGIMAEDVDFVTVRGVWLQGRANFEKYHTRILSGRFRDSTNTPLEIRVRFLRPDEAAVHWSWVMKVRRARTVHLSQNVSA